MERQKTARAPGGKLPPVILEKMVLAHQGARRPEVIRGAGIGVDAAVLRLGGGMCVFSVDPITGSSTRTGELCIYVACNDLAAAGAEPVAVGITLLVPLELGEEYVARFMAEADAACRKLKVAIAGGHTELVPGLPLPLVCVAALGQPWPGCRLPEGPQAGDALVLTKGAGIEGAAVLAVDFPARLSALVPADVIDRARSLFDSLSVLPEAKVAVGCGATAMHDVTEGGVLGAAWEMAYAAGLGVEIRAEEVPVPPEVDAICRALSVDPLRLVSSGSLLVAVPDPGPLLGALGGAGIRAAVVGRVVPEGNWLLKEGARVPILSPEGDELWRAREMLAGRE
ncbi:MAG: AIR synthase family protein [Bacillota bacterium]|nr:AIR synthase family protein [Bacillota bacterium]